MEALLLALMGLGIYYGLRPAPATPIVPPTATESGTLPVGYTKAINQKTVHFEPTAVLEEVTTVTDIPDTTDSIDPP